MSVDSTPNDANWTVQWGPKKIKGDYAWNTTAGNRTSILVAVIDSGIDYNHPDLAANYVPLGYDFVNNDSDPKDDNGHGTHCAGVIAAQVNNTLGIAGLAQVRIMAEKGMNSAGSGSYINLANCIYHAVDQGAKILSNSWGGGDNSLIHDAVVYAANHNVLFLASSGNSGANSPQYPGAYNEVVCVAASDSNDDIASFSTWGSWVDVAAPGVNIFSTMPTYHVTLNDSPYNFPMNYSYLNGTSMACPHAAGVAALIWSQFPNLAANGVRNQLIATVDDRGIAGFDPYFGSGRINAQKGVEQSPPASISVSVGVSPNLITIGSGTNISGSVASSGLGDKSGTVYFELSPNNLTWVSVGSTQSDSSGKYSYWCVPPLSGALFVRSYWIGNNNYEASTSISAILSVNSGDIYEPDDSFATAHLISVLTTLSSETHDLEPAGNYDYFRFYVDSNSIGFYSFYTVGSTDTFGYLYNSTYNQLFSNDDDNGYPNFRVGYDIRTSGTYYVMVRGYDSTIHGPYVINYYYSPTATTRKMLTEKWVVNGLNASQLTTQSLPSLWSSESTYAWLGSGWDIYWGMRVWSRSSSGVESELTSGTPVAIVGRYGSSGYMVQSSTWNCPGAELNRTDSIVVRVYTTHGNYPWNSLAELYYRAVRRKSPWCGNVDDFLLYKLVPWHDQWIIIHFRSFQMGFQSAESHRKFPDTPYAGTRRG